MSNEKQQALIRALNLLPYFRKHPHRSVMEAAADLGRSPEEIVEDLDRLRCCGVGTWPEELVDLDFNFREVNIINDQGMDKALRLTATEAGALLLTLESLEAMGGLIDRDAVVSASTKLRAILDPQAVAVFDSIADVNAQESATLMALREAMDANSQVQFSYYSASADTHSVRVVDPVILFVRDKGTYLTAWEEASGQHKTFRTSRMAEVTVVPNPANPHSEQLGDIVDGFHLGPGITYASIALAADATWLASYFPIELGVGNTPPEAESTAMVPARMPVGSTQWFIRFALGQSDRLQVLGGPELRAEVRSAARAGLAAYDETPERRTMVDIR